MSFDQIRKKIELLKRADPNFKLFGASSHRYAARAVATDQEISDFEEVHGIILPDDYRDYLTQIGNGGIGPYYGIAGLEDHDYLYSEEIAPNLQAHFPHRASWNLSQTFFEEWSNLQEAEDEPGIERMETEYWGPQWIPGSLEICDYGCNLRFLLVISGEERGAIWFDKRVDWQGIHPVQLSTMAQNEVWMSADPNGAERATLSQWMDAWLEHSLALAKGT